VEERWQRIKSMEEVMVRRKFKVSKEEENLIQRLVGQRIH